MYIDLFQFDFFLGGGGAGVVINSYVSISSLLIIEKGEEGPYDTIVN